MLDNRGMLNNVFFLQGRALETINRARSPHAVTCNYFLFTTSFLKNAATAYFVHTQRPCLWGSLQNVPKNFAAGELEFTFIYNYQNLQIFAHKSLMKGLLCCTSCTLMVSTLPCTLSSQLCFTVLFFRLSIVHIMPFLFHTAGTLSETHMAFCGAAGGDRKVG